MTAQKPDPTNQELSAWIDGGLNEAEDVRMMDLAASREDIAARAARLRRMDDLVRAVVPAEESIPDELLARLGLAKQAVSTSAQVIDLAAARSDRPAAIAPARRWLSGPWAQARAAAQILLVLGLGAVAVTVTRQGPESQFDAAYHTLSDGSGMEAQANAVMVLAKGTSLTRAGAIAEDAGARMIGVPGETGAVRLAIDPARRSQVLARLRADREVLMVEPLDGSGE